MSDGRAIQRLGRKKATLLQRLQQMDDVMPGSLVAARLPCNKGNCKCTRGELHGPTWRLTWNESGKSRILYIRQAELASVKKGTERYRNAKSILKQIAFLNLELLKAKRET